MTAEYGLLSAAQFVPKRMVFPNSWIGHLPFAAWLISVATPARFVELGSHSGNSYLGFCQSVKASGQSTLCFAIDTWSGDQHAGYYDDEIFDTLEAYHNPEYGNFSELVRTTFDEALDKFTDSSIDLLHIDGLHTYKAVRHDFETWLPKLSSNGIVLFHDTNVREREFGVWQLWAELTERYPHHLEFTHSNGLGVLRLGTDALPEELEWLNPNSSAQAEMLAYFAALGHSTLEQYRAQELAELNARQEEQIAALKIATKSFGLRQALSKLRRKITGRRTLA